MRMLRSWGKEEDCGDSSWKNIGKFLPCFNELGVEIGGSDFGGLWSVCSDLMGRASGYSRLLVWVECGLSLDFFSFIQYCVILYLLVCAFTL